MTKPFQFLLLACGVLALLAVGGEIIYSIAATTHGSTPARVVRVQAGPYPLTVSLYTYRAHASYALPFAIAPQQSTSGALTYEVSSIPDPSDVPVRDVPFCTEKNQAGWEQDEQAPTVFCCHYLRHRQAEPDAGHHQSRLIDIIIEPWPLLSFFHRN